MPRRRGVRRSAAMPFFSRRKVKTAVDPVSPPSDFIGLKNQGKTCHLNTVLQALFMTDEFRLALQECAAAGKLEPLPDALCSLFEKLETSNGSVSTKAFSATLSSMVKEASLRAHPPHREPSGVNVEAAPLWRSSCCPNSPMPSAAECTG